jgi:hypothetical protein
MRLVWENTICRAIDTTLSWPLPKTKVNWRSCDWGDIGARTFSERMFELHRLQRHEALLLFRALGEVICFRVCLKTVGRQRSGKLIDVRKEGESLEVWSKVRSSNEGTGGRPY